MFPVHAVPSVTLVMATFDWMPMRAVYMSPELTMLLLPAVGVWSYWSVSCFSESAL